MPTVKPRVTIVIDSEVLQKIEDYQFENRCRSQSQAIVELATKGLQKLQGDISQEQNTKNPPAQNEQTELTRDEAELLDDYRDLNKQGKEYIRQTMQMVKGNYKKTGAVSDVEAV